MYAVNLSEPRRRCLLCSAPTNRHSTCPVCGGNTIVIGRNSDKDFLYTGLGQVILYYLTHYYNMDWRQAWQYMVYRLEKQKLEQRLLNPPIRTGLRTILSLYEDGSIAKRCNEVGDRSWFW